MRNVIASHWWDEKNRMGHIELNGYNVSIYKVVVGYKKDGFTPKRHFMAQVANDWNISNLFQVSAPTVKGLLGKIKRHPHRLVSNSVIVR